MGAISVYLPERQIEILDLYKLHGQSKSKVVREALEKHIQEVTSQQKSSRKRVKKIKTNNNNKEEKSNMNVNVNLEMLSEMINQCVEKKLKELVPNKVDTPEIQNVPQPKPKTSESSDQNIVLVKVKNIYWKNEKLTLAWILEPLDDSNSNGPLYKYFNLKSPGAIKYILLELKKLNIALDNLTQVQEYDWSSMVGKTMEVDVQKKDDKDVVYFVRMQ